MQVEIAIALEIQRTNPKVSETMAQQYSAWVMEESVRNDLDPWLLHGIAHVESRWTAKAFRKERDGSCSVGLGQINVGNCEPGRVQTLKDPRENLRAMSDFLSTIRSTCRKNCEGLRWLRFYNYNNKQYVSGLVEPVIRRCRTKYEEQEPQRDHLPVQEVPARVYFPWMLRKADA